MVRALRSIVRFWIDFVLGDDWLVAAMVGVALIGSFGLVLAGLPAWWLLPLTVLLAITLSVRRAGPGVETSVSAREDGQAAADGAGTTCLVDATAQPGGHPCDDGPRTVGHADLGAFQRSAPSG